MCDVVVLEFFRPLGCWSEGFVSTKIALQVNKRERFGDRQGMNFSGSRGDETN